MKKTTPTELALKALKKIEQHEKECGERWAEATVQLQLLHKTVERHGQRWEKSAWLIVSGIGLTILTLFMKGYW
mgnify:CR=1 FL=1|jgi:hypothetical protein|tara:strand:+ start:467 stop:688 length:222 start_codon:yes stop_codon:yes gene_type:complete